MHAPEPAVGVAAPRRLAEPDEEPSVPWPEPAGWAEDDSSLFDWHTLRGDDPPEGLIGTVGPGPESAAELDDPWDARDPRVDTDFGMDVIPARDPRIDTDFGMTAVPAPARDPRVDTDFGMSAIAVPGDEGAGDGADAAAPAVARAHPAPPKTPPAGTWGQPPALEPAWGPDPTAVDAAPGPHADAAPALEAPDAVAAHQASDGDGWREAEPDPAPGRGERAPAPADDERGTGAVIPPVVVTVGDGGTDGDPGSTSVFADPNGWDATHRRRRVDAPDDWTEATTGSGFVPVPGPHVAQPGPGPDPDVGVPLAAEAATEVVVAPGLPAGAYDSSYDGNSYDGAYLAYGGDDHEGDHGKHALLAPSPRRNRIVAMVAVGVLLLGTVAALATLGGGDDPDTAAPRPTTTTTEGTTTTTTAPSTTSTAAPALVGPTTTAPPATTAPPTTAAPATTAPTTTVPPATTAPPTTAPQPAPTAPPPDPGPRYDDCVSMWLAGDAPASAGTPAYRDRLDDDHDGLACEFGEW